MNKSFFKRPFYNIAGKISKVMRDFQKSEDEKLIKIRNESWNQLFNGKESFTFSLNKDIKINLYKDSVLSKLIFDGFETAETEFICSVLQEGDIFVDVGANIGLFSLIASKFVGPEGLVICFEPSPTTFDRLVENVNQNCLENIDLRNIGLSNSSGELTFYISENGYDAWNSFAPGQDNKLQRSIQVPVSTLDKELSGIDKSRVKVIKIDVEGWEKFVLYGGQAFLKEYSPIVIVEFTEENTFNAGYPVYDLYDIMENYGYSWHIIKNGRLIKEKKKLHYPYINLVAIKTKN